MTNTPISGAPIALQQWVQAYFDRLAQPCPALFALSGDAGYRRYFRLNSQPPLLAVYAPPSTEDSHAFVSIARHWQQHQLQVPRIYAVDYEQGFLLVEDLGQSVYLPLLTAETQHPLYLQALNSLLQLQTIPPESSGLGLYTAEKLQAEMQLFADWFVEGLLHTPVLPDARRLLDTLFNQLIQSALVQPQRIVHRDFHSRNLIARQNAQGQWLPPGVIDFQDALIGPITYDLVSLLRDCYIHWPRPQVEAWVAHYQQAAQQAGLMPNTSAEAFLKAFDWMGLQRHLKVLGIFARLSLRDGKHGYLNDLPLVVAYCLQVARRYQECAAFVAWFESQLMPLIHQQPWFRPVDAEI